MMIAPPKGSGTGISMLASDSTLSTFQGTLKLNQMVEKKWWWQFLNNWNIVLFLWIVNGFASLRLSIIDCLFCTLTNSFSLRDNSWVLTCLPWTSWWIRAIVGWELPYRNWISNICSSSIRMLNAFNSAWSFSRGITLTIVIAERQYNTFYLLRYYGSYNITLPSIVVPEIVVYE